MNKILFLLIISPLLVSCSVIRTNNDKDVIYVKNINYFNILINQFSKNIKNICGLNEILIMDQKNFVKKINHYKSPQYINFKNNNFFIETIENNHLISYLRQTITNRTFLNKKNLSINKKYFFYKKSLNNNKKIFFLSKQINYFADYLLKIYLQIRYNYFREIWSITVKLIPNYTNKRVYKYLNIVNKASRKYGVDRSLILAIMETESGFNPYAVSHSDALGLMQIVQQSAGRDVFKMKGKLGQPTRSYLFNPKNNIDMGTAYLSILQNKYLNDIINPISRNYTIITAYNSGVDSVLKIFSRNRHQAFQIINSMQPHEVYQILYTQHPSLESRRYLHKVCKLQKSYWK